MWRRAFILIFFSFVYIQSSYAGEYVVFGPHRYERSTAKPITETFSFSSPVAGPDFTLKVENGSSDSKTRISSCTIVLNGNKIVNPSAFNQQVGLIEKKVSLNYSNEISISLSSNPGGFVDITIIGVDNIPPELTITSPEDRSTTDKDGIGVTGEVFDETPVAIQVNGISADVTDRSFSVEAVPLEPGKNTLTAVATDLAGNISTYSVRVLRRALLALETQAPPAAVRPAVPTTATARPISPPEKNSVAPTIELIPADNLPLRFQSSPLDCSGQQMSVTYLKQYLTEKYRNIDKITSGIINDTYGPKGYLDISGNIMPTISSDQSDVLSRSRSMARAFISEEACLFGLTDLAQIREENVSTDPYEGVSLYFHKYVEDLPIEGTYAALHMKPEEGITSVYAELIPITPEMAQAATRPRLSDKQISEIVKNDLQLPEISYKVIDRFKLSLYATYEPPYVVYEADITLRRGPGRWLYRINAFTGEILQKLDYLMEAH